MSMEAQFYEALRRQRIIERRQTLGVRKQVQQPKYQSHYAPVGVLRQDDLHVPRLFNPLRRTKLAKSDQCLYQRDRDIYGPCRPPSSSQEKRSVPTGKLHNRFSSMNYIQQW